MVDVVLDYLDGLSVAERMKEFGRIHNMVGYYKEIEWRRDILNKIKECVNGQANSNIK